MLNSTSSIMTAHKLMQQYDVMDFARDQAHILNYHQKNVSRKRMENINVLQRNVNVNMNTGSNHGQKVTLSSSFVEVKGGIKRRIMRHSPFSEVGGSQISLSP